ncbi:TolC family protein [Planktomarina temperata]|nr:TolC family protein [Planktomarina temperata]
MTKAIMIQGAGSNVGKSILVAGICRALVKRGHHPAPFKPQNMSNNAAVTVDGGEIGRAQALQALACGRPAIVDMNPVLLKPESEIGAQVVVQGQRLTTVKARDYAALKPTLMPRVLDSFHRRSVEFVSLRSANVELIEQELRAAQDRFEVGEVTRTDVALAEARLASARAALAGAQGDLAKAAAEYNAVVGRKPGDLVTPSSLPKLPKDASAAIATARAHHPNLKRVQYEVAAAELALKVAQQAYRPKFEAGAGLSNVDLDSSLTRNLSLTVSGPIYSGGAIASASRAAMAQRDAKRAGLHVAGLEVEQEVRNAFVVLEVARAKGTATDRQIEAASVAFRGVREEASLGARTTLDVLNAEQELLDARVSRISTRIDEQIASYSLLAAMGKLTATELDLGVKTYDPAEYYNLVKSAPRAKSKQGAALDRVLQGLAGN